MSPAGVLSSFAASALETGRVERSRPLMAGRSETYDNGVCGNYTGARRHAHWVGYTMGYRRGHGVNLTFEINYLRETSDSDPSLQMSI